MVGKLFRVVFTKDAQKSLKKISDYYKRNASSTVAKKVRKGLVDEGKKLETLPASRPLLPIKKEVTPPYRYAKKWSFKIIFQIFKKQDTVRVIDFLHDKENPDKWDDL